MFFDSGRLPIKGRRPLPFSACVRRYAARRLVYVFRAVLLYFAGCLHTVGMERSGNMGYHSVRLRRGSVLGFAVLLVMAVAATVMLTVSSR